MRSKLSYLLRTVITSVLVMSIGVPAVAQNPTGSISGTIKDPNDAVIQNAVVTATNNATGATRKLDAGSDGKFAFDNLLPGVYEVKVENGKVKYYENGSLKYTSSKTATYPLIVDSTIGTVGAGLQNAIITK